MAKHHPDLIFCRKQPGVAIGRLCDKCKKLFYFAKIQVLSRSIR